MSSTAISTIMISPTLDKLLINVDEEAGQPSKFRLQMGQ